MSGAKQPKRRPDPWRRPTRAEVAEILGDPERKALLGTAPDADLARAWGVRPGSVQRARYELGVLFSRGRPPGEIPGDPPSFSARARHAAAWRAAQADPEKMALLGTAPDAALARQWGVSAHLVRRERERRDIPLYRGPRDPVHLLSPRPRRDFLEGHPERVALLGTAPDAELAAAWGVPMPSVFTVRRRRGIPAFNRPPADDPELLAALGTETDKALAARFRCSPSTLSLLRKERGIPPFEPEAPAWWADVGKLPDTAVAKKWGLPRTTVSSRRYHLGLPLPPGAPRRRTPGAAGAKKKR